jgi:hypothetical protein
MPWVGFEPTLPASERAKTVHALDRAATVTGFKLLWVTILINNISFFWARITLNMSKVSCKRNIINARFIIIRKYYIYEQYVYINIPLCGSTALCWATAAFSVSWSFTRSVELLGRGTSPSPGHYLHTGQHEHRINAHSLSGIRTRDPSIHALDRAATC